MGITWFNKPKDLVVTLSQNNITLNKPATLYFGEAYAVMLGIDNTNNQFLIKPISRNDIEKDNLSAENYYRITVRSSYSRVVNKAFNEALEAAFNITIGENMKLDAVWDERQKMLKVFIKEGK